MELVHVDEGLDLANEILEDMNIIEEEEDMWSDIGLIYEVTSMEDIQKLAHDIS